MESVVLDVWINNRFESSKVFLTGSCQTEQVEYLRVIKSTVETLRLSKLSQMVIMMGHADISGLTLLSQTLQSHLELSHAFSAVLPLVLSNTEDGLTYNNSVSGQMVQSTL